jgi:catechol 2,3-dioxygenase-like lactoylglutathione lyase family enzyme
MIDHVGLGVSDYEASKAFYAKALEPLGIELLMEPVPEAGGFGKEGKPFFWISGSGRYRPVDGGLHVAFECENRELVDAFHAAAIAAGGTDNGPAGPRPIYHPDYYGAFVLDLDGNNVEAVCHRPA